MSIRTAAQIKKAIKKIKQTKRFEEVTVDNLEKCLMLKMEIRRKVKEKIDTTLVFSEDVEEKFKAGEHIADLSKMRVERGFLEKFFLKACELRKKFDSIQRQAISNIIEAIHHQKIDFEKLQEDIVSHNRKYFDTLTNKFGIDVGLLNSISLTVFRPIFEICVEKKRESIKDYEWKKGYCPFCGTNPGMAKLEKEVGRRSLWCPLCGTEWVYRRIKCPFCENENQKLIRFFFLEEKSPYRVDVCDKCKCYIKTIDERKRDEKIRTQFEIENLSTAYLDDIALKEKFKKK